MVLRPCFDRLILEYFGRLLIFSGFSNGATALEAMIARFIWSWRLRLVVLPHPFGLVRA